MHQTFKKLSLDNVSFRYPGNDGQHILSGVSIELFKGERIGIIGDNGAGKSTISKLILGIHPPDRGTILINGYPVSWNYHYPFIAYVGDPGYSTGQMGLPFDMTVSQLLDVQKYLLEVNGIEHTIPETARRLGIDELMAKKTIKLSTGQRKRLMLTLALGKTCDLIVLDEPFDGLDKDIRKEAENLLQDKCKEQASIVFIGHNWIEIDTFTNRVYKLSQGALTEVHRPFYVADIKKASSEVNSITGKPGEIIGHIQGMILHDQSHETSNFSINLTPYKP